jgi:hypothetical protein
MKHSRHLADRQRLSYCTPTSDPAFALKSVSVSVTAAAAKREARRDRTLPPIFLELTVSCAVIGCLSLPIFRTQGKILEEA